MKVECSCGAKYEFAVRPEMQERPVSFHCPACGRDASAFVDALVRRELGQTSIPSGEAVPAILPKHDSPPQLGVKVLRSAPAKEAGSGLEGRNSDDEPGIVSANQFATACSKHPGQLATEKCYICSKPICPKCMELFGYACSPLCKAKAESHGVTLPVYQGQKSVIQANQWRKLVWTSTGAVGLVISILALWFWYAWFGCAPKPIFSVRFSDPAYSGQSVLAGKLHDQIVFLHGGTLARYDLKSGKPVWSKEILDQDLIQKELNGQLTASKSLIDKANSEDSDQVPRMPSSDRLLKSLERDAAAALALHVKGQNIWVSSPGKLAEYQWENGQLIKEVPTQNNSSEPIYRGDEVRFVDTGPAKPVVTRVSLLTGDVRQEELNEAEPSLAADTLKKGAESTTSAHSKPESLAGMPSATRGTEAGKPMDPAKIAAQAQGMSLPEKLALPATLSANINQQRALNELDASRNSAPGRRSLQPGSSFSLVPTKDGFIEFSTKLLESRVVTRSAMKPGSGKSVLDGDITAGKSMEMSSEMLNEMQRSNGGDLVEEDHSRYQVVVGRPGRPAAWSGEVIGRPKLYPLDTVTVLAAEKLILVLNKADQKIWQSTLAYNIARDINALDEDSGIYGRGPCVEHNGSLYVFDEGVLSAFDLASGNARWRLPSVGIMGLFFDDQEMLYVNTSTASHESLKYSRQIDLSRKVSSVILKVDARNGKIVWSETSLALVTYVSGKILLTAASFMPEEQEGPDTGFEKPPWTRIRRLNPVNGREVWEHFQDRAALDFAFEGNTIRLVFKKEVQVLKFPTF